MLDRKKGDIVIFDYAEKIREGKIIGMKGSNYFVNHDSGATSITEDQIISEK